MNLIKCSNNHFYDASKFPSCPHCKNAGETPAQDNPTVPVDNGQGDVYTMPATGAMLNPPVTPQPVQPVQPVAPGLQRSTPSSRPEDDIVTMPVQPDVVKEVQLNPKPQSDISTDSLDNVLKDFRKKEEVAAPAADDDDQHTIGYYDTADSFKIGIEPVVGWLVVISGSEKGRSVTIRTGRSSIGRGTSNDIVIDGDKSISREKHAVIVFEPKHQLFLLQPGTSRELFYLNGDVVLDTKQLKPYDKIEIGKTNLLFVPLCGENFSWDSVEEEEDKK